MNAGSIIASIKLKTDEFKRGLKDVTTGLEKTSKDFKKVGAAATALGGAMAIGIGSAVTTAAKFEQAMSRVGAVADATDTDMKLLTDTAKHLGATTSYSAVQAAEGMQYLAMAGFDAKEIIAAMPGVLDMAAAGAVELGDAANIASNIMSGFGLESEESARVADVLTKAFTSSNTTLGGLGETMKYVAPAASSVGWSLESMAAAAGKLGDVGIDASMAGTALRKAVINLASPTDEAAGLLKKYNINIADTEGNMRPLADILADMKTNFAGLTSTQRASAAQTIFGTNAMSAMLALMEDPQGLKQFTTELENAKGTAGEIAEKQLDNLLGSLTLLSSSFEGAKIAIGTHFIPIIQSLTKALTGLVSWFNGLSEPTQKAIAMFLGISTVLLLVGGGVLLFIGFLPQLIKGFKSVKVVATALKGSFTLLSGPIGLIILAVMALVAVFAYLWKNNETFRNKVIEIWNSIVAFLTPIISSIVTFLRETFDGLVAWWNEIMPTFLEACSNVWNGIWAVLKPIIMMIVEIFKFAFPFIKMLVLGVWENIKGVIEGALGVIRNIVEIFSYLFTGQWSKLWDSVKSLIANALKLIWNAFQLWGTGKMLKGLGKFVGKFLGKIGGLGKNLLKSVGNFLGKIFGKFTGAGTTIKGIFTGISDGITGLFKGMVGKVLGKIDDLVGGLKNKVMKAKDWLGELNPFKRHSPSLVDNVLSGVKKIKDTYSSVSGLEVKAPKIGNIKPGRIDVGAAVGLSAIGGSGNGNGGTNYNAPLVQVENMNVRNDQDIRGVSNELYNLQRNSDRARGR